MTQASVQIINNESQVPLYVNVIESASLAGSVIINFGYLDPSTVQDSIEKHRVIDGVAQVDVPCAVKIVMSRSTARAFIENIKASLGLTAEQQTSVEPIEGQE